jgi:hypothetical protein
MKWKHLIFLLFIPLFEQKFVLFSLIDWDHQSLVIDDCVKLWKLLVFECNE